MRAHREGHSNVFPIYYTVKLKLTIHPVRDAASMSVGPEDCPCMIGQVVSTYWTSSRSEAAKADRQTPSDFGEVHVHAF